MNKKISTLFATGALLVASVGAQAQADIVKGDYYHLETQELGNSTAAALNLVLTKETTDGKAALVAFTKASALAKTDSALWKIDYTLDVTSGQYSYTFKNKATGTQLSFAAGSNMGTPLVVTAGNSALTGHGTKDSGALSGTLNFNWGSPLSAGVPTDEKVLSSYVVAKDSTLSLAVRFDASAGDPDNGIKYTITQVMTKGNTKQDAGAATVNNAIVAVKAVRATSRVLSADELNDKLGKGRGFQLFFFHKNALVSENNPLTNVIFEAVPGTDGVMLKAKTLAPKTSKASVSKSLYAYLDTISYSASSNLPTAGDRMTFRVDTLPTTDGLALTANGILTAAAYTFNFIVDPSSPKDSVAVFLNASYNPTTGTAPRTYTAITAANNAFPLQVDAFGGTATDKTILTTTTTKTVFNTYPALASAPVLSKDSRISFTGGTAIDPLFDATKVYSVKNINKAVGDADAGKYMVLAPTSGTAYGEAYSNMVFDHLPSTQFVFDGVQMINREDASTVSTGSLYKVKDQDAYTNLTDTFEIKVMSNVNLQDSTIGWSCISADSLTNFAFSMDYISGILEGRSINVKADSSVVATTEAGKVFKLEAVNFGKLAAGADIDEVKAIYNQSYKIFSKDKKFVVVKNGTTGKLALTSVTSAAGAAPATFYLKDTKNKGEYILINGTDKYNVNSTNESLEAVGLNLTDNAFAIQVEGAPEYVLDAKGHYNIENLRGDKLAADAKGFGMLRKEGELKAAYEKNDFALYVDTAKIHATAPSYFILSGAKAEAGTSKLEGNFLRVMSDSVTANVEGYKAANGMTRLAFVPAKREATSDSLLVNYQKATLVKGDSVGYKNKQAGIDQFQFKIQYTETEGQYIVENAAGYLATYNDVLCLTAAGAKDQAQLFKLTTVDAPTSNEGVTVSEVSIIAGQGSVRIAGAAGKKVVISNILGQVIANTVITSDDATIAVPAGVVVVVVEGEEAVKAIVK